MLNIKEILERNPVIPAIKDKETFEAALLSNNEVVFIIISNIVNIKNMCEKLKEKNKIVFVHIDMIDGLSSTNSGIEYVINEVKPTGILTTKSNVIAHAYKNNIMVIQRFLVLDSFSLEKTITQIRENKSIAIEILPGLMPKIIKKLSSKVRIPIITGGLIQDKEDIINILNAGASSVSTTNKKLWNI